MGDMKKIFLIILSSLNFLLGFSQNNQTDSGVYLIHKFEQRIGQEKYTSSKSEAGVSYHVDFKYVDRGSPVSLEYNIHLTKTLRPVSFGIKGGTSRFTTVHDSVAFLDQQVYIKVDDSAYNRSLENNAFPVAGYSPATGQMLLIQYWNNQHRPETIRTIPFGSVQIVRDGADTIASVHEPEIFTRYIIKGLIWGNELLWTDARGQLICLITNDAEGDKQEMMFEPYEFLLPVFIEKAAVKGMKLFANETKGSVQRHRVIVIRGGTMVDVVHGKTIPDATILIENGIIKAAGITSSVRIPANAFVIEAKGKTILPGLWDMHAHFEQAEWGPAYLAAGVTTVRDCGNEFGYINAIQKAIDHGDGIGPLILKAGIIDGKGPFALGIVQADTKAEAVAAVQRYKDNGFVQIKIYSSVKPEIVRTICLEAHRLGLTVTGHIPFAMNLIQAVDSGMDMVNHLQYISSLLKKNKADGSIDFSDPQNVSILEFINQHHLVVDPTLGVYELSYRSMKDNIITIEPNFATLPEPLKPLFINEGLTNEKEIERGKTSMKILKQVLYALYKDSIVIVAGTDMGIPGYSVFRELELYVESGLSPMAAIRTATICPAKAMDMQSVSGSLDVGKRADIILVDGNPIENIRNIRKVKTVIRDSILYDPVELHRIAGFQ
jgi:imidazolonepropionase-like amidohydrolase